MEKVFETLVAFQVRVLAARNERGQGTLEYIGMIIVAALIVIAVLDVSETIDLGSIFQNNVDSVTERGAGG
ncbi:hypothetical protein [Nocardioides gilvus]|uniref:hypothetical protein n=1 Tax=Nocardioides gilvus TaxID=1735589 RepID=UPI000D74E5F1|nr:hypothetical protein [Nocardioides gilvus]